MPDVFLLNPPLRRTRLEGYPLSPPLGLGYIAAVLMRHGYEVSALDLNPVGWQPARVRGILEREQPCILGISAYPGSYPYGLESAGLAKEINPKMVVVMGGPYPTDRCEDVAREESVDYVIRGEGEITALELADSILKGKGRPGEIPGLAYKEPGRMVLTPERDLVEDPDCLPFPARELFTLNLYPQPGTVLVSRPGKEGRRYRSPENVSAEIIYLIRELNITAIHFADDTFTLDRDRVFRMCARFRQIQQPIPWTWTCATRAELVDWELVEEMHSAGCTGIRLDIEAGSRYPGQEIQMVKDAGMNILNSGIDEISPKWYS